MVFWGVDHWELGNPEKHDILTSCLWIYNAGVSYFVLIQIMPSPTQIRSMNWENTIESEFFLFEFRKLILVAVKWVSLLNKQQQH